MTLTIRPVYASAVKVSDDSFTTLMGESDALMQNREFEAAMGKAIDALEVARSYGSDEQEAEAMCAIAKIDIATSRDDHAWNYALKAEKIARDSHLKKMLAKAILLKAQICLYAEISEEFNRNDEGLAYVEEVLSLTEGGDTYSERAMAYIIASQIYVNKNRWNERHLDMALYRKAGEYLSLGETLAQEHNITDMTKQLLSSRMRYYRQGANFAEAIDFCQRHLESCDPADYLTIYQLYDHLTSLYLETGQGDKAMGSHSNCVYNMQRYISQKADNALQEQETKYETALKQQTIRRRGYQLISAILALILLVVLAVLLVIRNRRIARQKEELNRQNQSKEELLTFISKDFANPMNAKVDTIHRFAQECSKLDPEEIRQRCDEFICGMQSLSNDVAQYVFNIIVSQKQAASSLELSDREVEIIRLSAQGLTAAQIAQQLYLSPRTVSNHRQNIYSKMDVKSNSEMISKAREAGIIKD